MRKSEVNSSLFTESTPSVTGKTLSRAAGLLWPYLSPYKARMAVALLAVAVAGLTMLAFGWGLKGLIDGGFSSTAAQAEQSQALDQALVFLLGMITLLAGASYTRLYSVSWLAERMVANLRRAVFAEIVTLDPLWFDRHRSGEWASRVNADTSILQMVVATSLPFLLRNIIMLIGGIAMMVIVSPSMAGLTLLVVPVVIVPVILVGRRVRHRSRDAQDYIAELGHQTQETVQAIQTVQSFGAEQTVRGRFDNQTEQVFKAALRYTRLKAFLAAFVIFFVFGAIGIVLWRGGHQVLAQEITAGDLSAFVFYAVLVSGAVGALSELIGSVMQAIGAADRILMVLEAEPHIKPPDHPVKLSQPVQGNVSFSDVTFFYPSRSERPALLDVSFDIKAGETVAVVGPSGAGKTTLFQLLQRFYDPAKGSVVLDGVNVRDMTPQDLRGSMGVVAQEPVIFSASVLENIRLGKPDATLEEVKQAAHKAQADGFIADLPKGYDTQLGERGSRLSGGQRQRIAIARAILRDPAVLLLDEATSSLDSQNELAVHQALKELMKGRTTLIIAHRMATVQNAEHIFVMDGGRIVATGTHESLYGDNRLYTHLVDLQMQNQQAA